MKNKRIHSSNTLGNYIRIMRVKRGYSQYYIANVLEISQNSYCLLENGQTRFSLDRIIQIAEIFELSPLDFISGYFIQEDY
jgi:transcriptional regulator with XRE-family HTH domain